MASKEKVAIYRDSALFLVIIGSISLKSINKNQTIITANYLGNKSKINDEFKNINLTITKKSEQDIENYFTLTINKTSNNQ